jgi:glycosyltransferase involved in cell wall biosynthesis
MSRLKVVYIISDINKSLAFEWIAKTIDRKKFDLSFILLGLPNSEVAKELKKLNIDIHEFRLGNKLAMLITFFRVFRLLLQTMPDIIHTHLFFANLIGLTAGKILNVPKRITTRHHAMIHHDEYPQGLKWDKYINRIATHVIAISQNTKNILVTLDKTNEKKIRVIHHGFDLNHLQSSEPNKIEALRRKYKTLDKRPVVGVISRYLRLKGIEYVIEAFKTLQHDFPMAHLVLANSNGNYKAEINKALASLPKDSVTEIEFENDLASLYQLFDVFVHVPINAHCEAFGQTYVEALAVGIPSVFTLSGVAPEFIVNEENALVVPFQNAPYIYHSILRIVNDSELREKLISDGRRSASSFSINKMVNSLTALYEE